MTPILDMASGETCEDNVSRYDVQSRTARQSAADVPEAQTELRLELVPLETTPEKQEMPLELRSMDIAAFLDQVD